jgi:hypothetical protein
MIMIPGENICTTEGISHVEGIEEWCGGTVAS